MSAQGNWLRSRFEIVSGNRLESMEGMRGFAALLVFLVHFQALFGAYSTGGVHTVFSVLGWLGHTGVDLFFVLSGYLIYGIVLNPRFRYWRYFRRRLKRLYPTFALVLALYVVLSVAGFGGESKILSADWKSFFYLLANLFVLPGMIHIQPLISVAWSLSYEWFFYLSMPVWIALLQARRRTPLWRITAVCVIAGIYEILCLADLGDCPRLLLFAAGILLWEIQKGGYLWPLGHAGELFAAALYVINVVALGLILSRRVQATVVPQELPEYYNLSLFVSLFFLCVYSLMYKGILSAFFSWRPLRWLGNMSYSYYLIHGLVLHGVRVASWLFVEEKPLPIWYFLPLVLIALAATVAAAMVLYLFVERPLSLARTTADPVPGGPAAPALPRG